MEELEMVEFNKLSEERQLNIVSNHMNNTEWYEDIYITFRAELEEDGFEDIDISFTGFWSQGDGASFTAKSLLVDEFFLRHYGVIKNGDGETFPYTGINMLVDEEYKETMEMFDIPEYCVIKEAIDHGMFDISVKRHTGGNYVHENSVFVDFDKTIEDINEDIDIFEDAPKEWNTECNNFAAIFERFLDTWVVDKCQEIYRRLEKEYNISIKAELEFQKELNNEFNTTE